MRKVSVRLARSGTVLTIAAGQTMVCARAKTAAVAAVTLAGISACLLLAAGPAAAAPAATFSQVDVRTVVNTCSGETVPLAGIAQIAIKPNSDGTSTFHVTVHAEGVGDGGNHYVLNVTRKSLFAAGGGLEIKVDSHEVLVSTGPAPNQLGTFHFDLRTGQFSFVVDCTG